MRFGLAAALAAMTMLFCGAALAQSGPVAAPTTRITVNTLPPATSPQAGFNAQKATNAYLAEVSGPARARSDAYFEGKYGLLVVDLVYGLVIAAALLWFRISARMRDIAVSWTRSRFLQVPIYVVLYMIVTVILSFPLSVYEDFLREHAYGLSNQTFVQWLGDQGTSLAVGTVVAAILASVVYALIRRSLRNWWIWGAVVVVGFLAFGSLIEPVFIAPLYNHYEALPDSPLKARILSLARAEGVPASNVYEFDASRQSKRISANVSGLFGTTRISLNDNLMKRCTPDEIVAVLGHEMGHYVLDHAALLITWMGLLFAVGLGFVSWASWLAIARFGGDWGVRGIDDPAGLPVLMAFVSIFFFFATPIQNTITRTAEAQADIFGLNAVRQPDGFAKVTLMLSEYRKLDPSPLEEFVFYDHPSGRSRIAMAMRWKAEHLDDTDIRNGPVSPQ